MMFVSKDVKRVNQYINKAVKYVKHRDDVWKTPDDTLYQGYGDCQDIATLKAWVLVNEHDFNEESIKIAFCRNGSGSHVVCIVDDFGIKIPLLNKASRVIMDVNKPYLSTVDNCWLIITDEISYGEAMERCYFSELGRAV